MTDFRLGMHEAKIDAILEAQQGTNERLDGLTDRVGRIERTLAERHGERRFAKWSIQAIAGVIALVVSVVVEAIFRRHG